MEDKKISASTASEASDAQLQDCQSIPSDTIMVSQNVNICQENTDGSTVVNGTTNTDDVPATHVGRRSWKKSKQRVVAITASVFSVAFKCYDEQLPYGWEETQRRIKLIDKTEMIVEAIMHNRDLFADMDDPFLPAVEKRHFHFICRCVNRNDRIAVCTLMKKLGIQFRKGIDTDLYKNHGVETIGNFNAYSTYLTHETEDAIASGKEKYEIEEIVSNLTLEEIQNIRNGYFDPIGAGNRIDANEWALLDQQAFQLGYNLKDYQDWFGSLSFKVRSNSKARALEASYNRAVDIRIAEKPTILRVCVYIQGEANKGKTSAAIKALAGLKVLSVGGGGTGKFDELRPSTDAIIINDDTCPNLINMSDNYVCRAYRRGHNNPAWTGAYLIITSNLEFEQYLDQCKASVRDKNDRLNETFNAIKSRFAIGYLKEDKNGNTCLAFKSISTRGLEAEKKERAGMLARFQASYNEALKNYKPEEDEVDTDWLIDPEYLSVDKVFKHHPGYVLDVVQHFCHYFWSEKKTDRYPRWGNTQHKKDDTVQEKLDYLHILTDRDLQKAANECSDYEIMNRIPVSAVRGFLEHYLYEAEYEPEDFDMESPAPGYDSIDVFDHEGLVTPDDYTMDSYTPEEDISDFILDDSDPLIQAGYVPGSS